MRKTVVDVIAVAVVVLALGACQPKTEGPPEIVVDRTACSHCGMLISEPIYAAAYQVPGSEGRVFDDIGCLIEAARKETSTDHRFWFRDASDGGWIEGDTAVFALSPEIRTPMGGGHVPIREDAGKHRGEIVRSLQDLMVPAFAKASARSRHSFSGGGRKGDQ